MKKNQQYLLLFLLIAGMVILAKIIQLFVLTPVIEAAYAGNSFEYLNKLLAAHQSKDPDVRNLDFYRTEIPKYINRLIVLGTYSIIFLWVIFKDNFKIFKEFFLEEKSAFSLALLRLVVTGVIIYLNFPSTISALSNLGQDALVSPLGWPTEVLYWITEPTVTLVLTILFQIFLWGSFVGIFTPQMIIGATITGFFVLGIPQFYGKIDHYHILWHVLLILSFSKPGNALSIDAWRKDIPQLNLSTSVKYGLPLKLTMIVIGLGYFFPGFWKFTFSGLEWIFSDNLKLKMYSKWLTLGGWTPAFRIDQYPFLYQTGALLTIIIELGFIFSLFFKKVRTVFVVAAMGFHFGVLYFMKIFFLPTMSLYVIFVNWEKLISKFTPTVSNIKDKLHSQSNFIKKYIVVGSFLVFGYVGCGLLLLDSWPFGVYPTFASLESETVPSILIEAENSSNNFKITTVPLVNEDFIQAFNTPVRLRGYLKNLLNSTKADSSQYRALSNILMNSHPELSSEPSTIKFYEIRVNTHPDSLYNSYKKEKLLFTYSFSSTD